MRCPHCEEETAPGKACEKCGGDIGSLSEIEVRYKDFKGSEMLDIKMTRHDSPVKGTPEAGTEREKGSGTIAEAERPQAARKGSLLIIIFMVAAALSAFFLLRFLFKF
ncbi:MAG: hypothetical protein M0Z79_09880 [Nitrospiraceae bacterium]|nr:hypothetical protein [Nitrospiraceae bacterium]